MQKNGETLQNNFRRDGISPTVLERSTVNTSKFSLQHTAAHIITTTKDLTASCLWLLSMRIINSYM